MGGGACDAPTGVTLAVNSAIFSLSCSSPVSVFFSLSLMVISTFSTRRWQASYIFPPFSRVVYRNTFWLARLCVYLFSRLKLLLRLWNELVGNCLYSKRVISAAVYNFHVCLPPVAIRGLAQSLEYKLFVIFSFLFNSGLTFSFWDGAPSFFSTSCASSSSSWLCVVLLLLLSDLSTWSSSGLII